MSSSVGVGSESGSSVGFDSRRESFIRIGSRRESSSILIPPQSPASSLSFSSSGSEPVLRRQIIIPGGGADAVSITPNPQIRRTPSVATVNDGNEILNKHPWLLLAAIFVAYMTLLWLVYISFPDMPEWERKHVKIPRSIDEAKALGNVLIRYNDNHYWSLLSGLSLVYIFLQTFALPGSIFLSIMSGFLFPFWTAILLVCFCSATGASFCYLLSSLVARNLVETHFGERIRAWSQTVEEQRDNLLSFIIFLRITPILPNWFINIAAPLIHIPLGVFWLGTFIGVAPPSVLAVHGGSTLNIMTSPTDYISWTSVMILVLAAFGALIPVCLRRR